MKKSITLLLILVLCTQLFSCQDNSLPLTSDNFSKDFVNSFSDNYRLVDPQLAYVTASPWEVEIKVDNDEKLYLSLIDNVDKAQFVSVTERTAFYKGPPSYGLFVYQTSTAPVPMKDWTIKSIRILEVPAFVDSKDNVLLHSKKYRENILASSTVLHTYDNNSSDFFDMIKNAYSMAETAELLSSPITYAKKTTEDHMLHFYSLLIEFNESDSIIWHSKLLKDSDNIYFECTTYNVDDVERNVFSMAKISEEYVEEIRGLIDVS